MSRPVTMRALVVGVCIAAALGAVAALGVGSLLLPGRTVAAIKDNPQEVLSTLDVATSDEVQELALEAIEDDPARATSALDLDEVAMNAIESDPARVQELVNEGGPTTADLCSALELSSNADVSDVSFYGC